MLNDAENIREGERRGFAHGVACSTHEGRECNCYMSVLDFSPLTEDDIRRTYELAEKYRWERDDDENEGSAPIFASLLYG